jgi:hypothetical protein
MLAASGAQRCVATGYGRYLMEVFSDICTITEIKAVALGAPFVKLVCMGRAMMIPGFLGSNIEGALNPERKKAVCGNWEGLPAIFQEIGGTAQEIFAGYQDVQKKVGKDAMKDIPYGAIAMWTCADKLNAGLQQLMAGARKFKTSEITRDDIVAANREMQRETRLQFVTEALDAQANMILNA